MKKTVYSKQYFLQKKSIETNSNHLFLKKTNILGINPKTDCINFDDISNIEIEYRKSTASSGTGAYGGRTNLWCVLRIITLNKVYTFDIAENDVYQQKIGEIVKDQLENTRLKGKIKLDKKIRELSYK
ncbi:MAG: hypothetical protein AAB909_00665 [Patescibacteria group bacterium]